MTKIIAVAGSEIERPQYVRMVGGAKVDSLVKGNVKRQKEGDSVRFISGNVLTGTRTAPDGFMGFYANQLTAIPEDGSHPEVDCFGLHIRVEELTDHRVEWATVSRHPDEPDADDEKSDKSDKRPEKSKKDE